jgi:hypothetical protein
MTGNGAKALTGDEKSLVEVHRKSAKMLDFQRIGGPCGFSGTCLCPEPLKSSPNCCIIDSVAWASANYEVKWEIPAGDGDIHETEAMKRLAVQLGIPADAVILDEDGLNTYATVGSTCMLFDQLNIERVLAVSHSYHLPRIKMTYQRSGREVYTVPAKETYPLTALPIYILREVAALWVYYLRPLMP